MTSWLFSLPSVTLLVVRENQLQSGQLNRYARKLNWAETVSLRNMTAIDYQCEHCAPNRISKFGTATTLEELRFPWFDGDIIGMNACVQRLLPTHFTLRELNILPDMAYGNSFRL
jgi:hypothetical protein